MSESEILNRIQQRTRGLVAEDLRSTSIVVSRMRELIADAHGLGHRHRDILAAMKAGGLQATWNTYKSCLLRMKKNSVVRPGASASAPTVRASGELQAAGTAQAPGTAVDPRCATHVLDALAEAKQMASRDYAQIARDLHRRNRK